MNNILTIFRIFIYDARQMMMGKKTPDLSSNFGRIFTFFPYSVAEWSNSSGPRQQA